MLSIRLLELLIAKSFMSWLSIIKDIFRELQLSVHQIQKVSFFCDHCSFARDSDRDFLTACTDTMIRLLKG